MSQPSSRRFLRFMCAAIPQRPRHGPISQSALSAFGADESLCIRFKPNHRPTRSSLFNPISVPLLGLVEYGDVMQLESIEDSELLYHVVPGAVGSAYKTPKPLQLHMCEGAVLE